MVENHHAVESVSEIHDHTIDSHSHKFLASTHSEETKHHHNTKKVDNHNHELISFFNSIFNSDASQNNKEKALFENKLDKHILSQIIDSPDLIPVYEKKNLWYHYSLPKSLKLEVIIPPPQGNPA